MSFLGGSELRLSNVGWFSPFVVGPSSCSDSTDECSHNPTGAELCFATSTRFIPSILICSARSSLWSEIVAQTDEIYEVCEAMEAKCVQALSQLCDRAHGEAPAEDDTQASIGR